LAMPKIEITRLILLFYAFARENRAVQARLQNRTPLALDGLQWFPREVGGKEFAAVAHGIGHQRATETARRAFRIDTRSRVGNRDGVVGALSAD